MELIFGTRERTKGVRAKLHVVPVYRELLDRWPHYASARAVVSLNSFSSFETENHTHC